MFDIEYKGGNAVVITTKKAKLICDPKLSVVGLKDLDTKNAVEIVTEIQFATMNNDTSLRIEGPGEFEVADFSITGIATQRHLDSKEQGKLGTVYRIEVGDVRIALLGNIDAKLTDEQLEQIGVVDILIIPVGGNGYTLDATSAAMLTRKIDAKAVIPVHYSDEALSYEVTQDTLETFTSELGVPVETTAKFKVKSTAVLPSTLTVVEVTRS